MLLRLAVTLALPVALLVAQPEKTAWDVLHEGLQDKNPETRRQAVTAVGSIGLAPEAIKLVENGLQDQDSLVRQTAAAELGEMKSKSSIAALKAALDDPAGEVAFAAAKSLWDLGDQAGREFIEGVLTGQQKSSEGAVSGAVRDAKRKVHDPKGLAMMGFKEASGALLGPFNIGIVAAEQALKDGSAGARVLAVTLLAQDCNADAIRILETASTSDKNWAVKAAAAKGLGRCGNRDAIPKLEQNLSESHPAVKFMAAASIVRLSLNPVEQPHP
jgi:HEAT repeat protein